VALLPRLRGLAFTHPLLQPRLEDHEQQSDHNQERSGVFKNCFGQVQQQGGTGDAAEQRRRQQDLEGAAEAGKFAPVAVDSPDVAGDQAHGVGDGCRHRGEAERHQNGEGDQCAGTDNAVDRSGPQPGQGNDSSLQ
jgi:hypothetical protein